MASLRRYRTDDQRQPPASKGNARSRLDDGDAARVGDEVLDLGRGVHLRAMAGLRIGVVIRPCQPCSYGWTDASSQKSTSLASIIFHSCKRIAKSRCSAPIPSRLSSHDQAAMQPQYGRNYPLAAQAAAHHAPPTRRGPGTYLLRPAPAPAPATTPTAPPAPSQTR